MLVKTKTVEESIKDYLFHGTSVKIEGRLRGGQFDNILWTAENPAVAQNYIPESGVITHIPYPYFLDDVVSPRDFWLNIANAAGYELNCVDYNEYNEVVSWSWKGGKDPTYQDLVDFIEKDLGYKLDGNCYDLKTSYVNGTQVVHPKDYKLMGSLYIIEGKDNLKIYDYASYNEADLMNVDYLKFDLFHLLQKKGYDAVRINDFAQSNNWGNLSHTSIGIFPSGWDKISYIKIDAQNFDWEDDIDVNITKEYEQWFEENKRD